MNTSYNYQNALYDFNSARQRAGLEEVLARMTGKSNELLSYDEVAKKLNLKIQTERGIRNIPVKAIVGSVGRYTDFTRTFLPLRDEDRDRWARVKAAIEDNAGLPPIEVYKVDEVYFVLDGNHRVSIARQEGLEFIEAHVIEVQTNVQVTPDLDLDDLLVKSEYAAFLEETGIARLRPNVDLAVTVPGQYEKLKERIRIHQYCCMDETCESEMDDTQAVIAWYDEVYTPFAESVRDRGLLHWFPGRTVTDLYLWVSEHRESLEKELGWEIQPENAISDLVARESPRAVSKKATPGAWRKSRLMDRYTEHLFNDILIPLSGSGNSWQTLEQGIIIARREGARLHGLHVVGSKSRLESPEALAVKAQFEKRCAEAGVEGKLAIETGEITPKICERAVLSDLMIIKADHPPAAGISGWSSPFRAIIQDSPRPIMALPGDTQAARLERALLAFDGSPKAKEALFMATYLAEQWKTSLVVYSKFEGSNAAASVVDYARRYLELHEIEAEYIGENELIPSVKKIIEEKNIDVVLMGSYGGAALKEITIGSTVNLFLRELQTPIFICR